MGFSRQEYLSGLQLPSPVDHVLSELSTMTRPSWVALQGMAHSFTELDKARAPAGPALPGGSELDQLGPAQAWVVVQSLCGV